eukprot:Gb_20564 [translate_table: standard]
MGMGVGEALNEYTYGMLFNFFPIMVTRQNSAIDLGDADPPIVLHFDRKLVALLWYLRNFASAQYFNKNTWLTLASLGQSLSSKKLRYMAFDFDENEHCKPSNPVRSDVPKGHFAVYVGHKRSRFIIPTAYLNHSLFRALLEKAEEEYGFDHQMGITIPCEEVVFEYLTSLLGKSDPNLTSLELDELINLYQCKECRYI